ncbi:MAG: hypothetical protein LBT40_00220 [Deltaproteobacteria bacterium]|nr:hypothetical protein [Deltaproteobacteria bacterium]
MTGNMRSRDAAGRSGASPNGNPGGRPPEPASDGETVLKGWPRASPRDWPVMAEASGRTAAMNTAVRTTAMP